MEYDEAVDIVSGLFRIEQWESDEYGERYAVLDREVEIRVFQRDKGILVIQAMFGEPIRNADAANSNEERLRYLLMANFARIIHNDEILSLDRRTGRPTTTKCIPLVSISFDFLVDSVESFVRNIDFWNMVLQWKQSSAAVSPLLSFFGKK
ncbi:MAG: type III secretion system chaperone [Puniceicoccales bacterium]|nr:type III secretion system chaperone [Puniceicoccales bacterium]